MPPLEDISDYPSGAPVQPSDLLVIERSGANFNVPASDFATAAQGAIAEAALPRAGGTITGPVTMAWNTGGYPLTLDMTAGDPHVRLFTIGGFSPGLGANPGDPARPNDPSWSYGYNMQNGAGRRDPTEYSLGIVIESCFLQGGIRGGELHITSTDTAGTEHRYLSLFTPHDGGAGSSMSLGADALGLYTYNGVQKLGFNLQQGYIDVLGNTVLRGNASNVPILQQKNAAGTGYNSLPYFDGQDRLLCNGKGAVFVGNTPTSGSWPNVFLPIQPLSSVSNGFGIGFLAPALTGKYTALDLQGSCSDSIVSRLYNTSSATFAHAYTEMLVISSSGGDPHTRYTVNGATTWYAGLDNSDNDSYKVSTTAHFGTGAAPQLTLTKSGDLSIKASVKAGSFTVAALPSAAALGPGANVYASNGRKSGEGAAAGTGIPVWSDGTNWRTYYDNSIAAA